MSADTLAQSPLFHPTTQLPRAAEQRRYWVPLLLRHRRRAALLHRGRAAHRLRAGRRRRDRPERGRRPDVPARPGGEAGAGPQGGRTGRLHRGRLRHGPLRRCSAASGSGWPSRWWAAKPGFPQTFTVMCWALLPGAIEALLAIPALLLRGTLRVEQLASLLPGQPRDAPAGGHDRPARLVPRARRPLLALVGLARRRRHGRRGARSRAGARSSPRPSSGSPTWPSSAWRSPSSGARGRHARDPSPAAARARRGRRRAHHPRRGARHRRPSPTST